MISRPAHKYLNDRDIELVLSFPYASETNGLVERAKARFFRYCGKRKKNIAVDADTGANILERLHSREARKRTSDSAHRLSNSSTSLHPANPLTTTTDTSEIPHAAQLRDEANKDLPTYLTSMKHFFSTDDIEYLASTLETEFGTLPEREKRNWGRCRTVHTSSPTSSITSFEQNLTNGRKETRTATATQLKVYREQPGFDDYDMT